MARLARVVLPDTPHHVTQRGARRLQTFFSDDDYRFYLELLGEFARKSGTRIWAYCLMPNHVHLVLVPETIDGLRATLAETHRRYTRRINFREDWRGHLWQERFHSFPMDSAHFLMAARYIELNPVRAGLVERAGDWRWSSAAGHLGRKANPLLGNHTMDRYVDDWQAFLDKGLSIADMSAVEKHLRTGRPLGDDRFMDRAERLLGRQLRPLRPGPSKTQTEREQE